MSFFFSSFWVSCKFIKKYVSEHFISIWLFWIVQPQLEFKFTFNDWFSLVRRKWLIFSSRYIRLQTEEAVLPKKGTCRWWMFWSSAWRLENFYAGLKEVRFCWPFKKKVSLFSLRINRYHAQHFFSRSKDDSLQGCSQTIAIAK